MKNASISFILLLICIGFALLVGCTSTEAPLTILTPTLAPQITHNITTTTPIPSPTHCYYDSTTGSCSKNKSIDHIVGVWRYAGAVYEFRIKFDSDGTTTEIFSDKPSDILYGTWKKGDGDKYIITYKSGYGDIMIYNASSNSLHSQDDPLQVMLYYPYQGDVQFAAPSNTPRDITVSSSESAFQIISTRAIFDEGHVLHITGTVTNRDTVSHTLKMQGAAYDPSGVKLGTGYDYVDVDPSGVSKFDVMLFDVYPYGSDKGEGSTTIQITEYSK